jgi:hypothetical protein
MSSSGLDCESLAFSAYRKKISVGSRRSAAQRTWPLATPSVPPRPSAATCTIAFRLGQQHIFYPGRDRAISLCNQYDVTPESLTRLRELRRSLAESPQRQAGSRMR